MRWLGIALGCLLLAGCATRRAPTISRVDYPDPGPTGHWIAAVPLSLDADRDPYDRILAAIVQYWHPPTRWQRWRRRDSAFVRDWRRRDNLLEADLRDFGLWSVWDTGTESGLMERVRADVPVWIFVQEHPFNRDSLRPALVVGFDEQRAVWWLYGLDEPITAWPQSDFGRYWAYADRHWVVIAPPQGNRWLLTPGERHARGRFWMAKEQFEQAAEDFGAALTQRPDEALYYIELADSHLRREQYTAAEPLYRAALRLTEDSARALNNLAYLLIQADGDLEEALRLARQAVSLQPQNPRLLDTLGVGLHRAGQLREATQVLQRARARALHEDPQTQAVIALHLVAVYHDLGQAHLARQTLADALAADPGVAVPSAFRLYLRPDQPVPR